LADPFKNVSLLDRFWKESVAVLERSNARRSLLSAAPNLLDHNEFQAKRAADGLFLFLGSNPEPIGWIANGHKEDESLSAALILENLCAKVSAALAVEEIFARNQAFKKDHIHLVLGCSEEAVGDRYQRGGGNLAKAIAEFSGCTMASGFDVKDFCAAPIPAIVTAAALVQARVVDDVLVVGGSSLPKLGMKFLYHVEKGMPVLEDMLAAVAVWVGQDDGRSPIINLRSVGRHPVSAGASLDQQLKTLVVETQVQFETMTRGDPTYSGPLAGIGLQVYQVFEPTMKAVIDANRYSDLTETLELGLEADSIVAALHRHAPANSVTRLFLTSRCGAPCLRFDKAFMDLLTKLLVTSAFSPRLS
jgi:hypothetical protein